MFSKEALFAVLLPNVGGMICSSYMKDGQDSKWFRNLKLPRMLPPPWIAGMLWVLHYTCMGFASYLVWNVKGLKEAIYPLSLYATNLLLCFAWAPIFFGFRSLKCAYINGLLNLISAFGTTVEFYKASAPAGILMLPYLLWLAYTALHLNHKIYIMNKKTV